MDGTATSYDNYNLNDSNNITAEIGDARVLDRELGIYRRIRKAGAIITNDTYGTAVIPYRGKIVGSSDTDLEQRIDAFKAVMARKGKILAIAYRGGTRHYVCTPQVVQTPRPVRAGNWAEFEIDFIITEYGKDNSATVLINNATVTASPTANTTLTVDGSAPEQFFVITYTLNSFTGASFNTISFANGQTGQQVNITRNWQPNDVVVIDTIEESVKVNGVEHDFSGAMPRWEPGSNRQHVYSDDFTDRNATLHVGYVKRWL